MSAGANASRATVAEERTGGRPANTSESRGALQWISQVAKGAWRHVVLLSIAQIIQGAISVSYALFLRGIVDHATAGDAAGFASYSLGFAAAVLALIALRALTRFLAEFSRASIENRCKAHLFESLLHRQYAAVAQRHSGEWMNRLTNDTVVISDGITQIVPNVAGMITRIVGAIAVLIVLQPLFAWVLIPGGLAMVLLTWGFRKVLKRLHKSIQEADGRLRTFLQERLGSMVVIHSFTRERETADAATALMDEHMAARMKRNRFSNWCNTGFSTAMEGAYVLGAIYCGWCILMGTMTYGTFAAVLQLVSQVQSPFANITGYVPRYYAMIASAERLMEVDALPADGTGETVPMPKAAAFYRDEFADIVIEGASFAYEPAEGDDATAVLDDFSLRIRKGEYLALTGPSGCGKSTILKILLALYPLNAGTCELESVNGARCPLDASWRSLFAYVPQGNQLLSGTIRQCVAFDDAELVANESALWNALDVACARSFVEQLQNGLDAKLGELGSGLSEGQMQRLAIARAIASDRPILLLDECTSSLDGETEAQLLRNLRSMTDRTVVVVTHRPGALEICDARVQMGTSDAIVPSNE